MAKKPKGFGKFDALMRKLVKVPANTLKPISRAEAERLCRETSPDADPLTTEEIDAVVKFATSGGKEGGMKPRKPKPKKSK